MVHIKRLDTLWIKLQTLIQILYFFYPWVWYANRRIIAARERTCDDMVLYQGRIPPLTYGLGVLKVLRLHTTGAGPLEPIPGFGNQRKAVEARLKHILKGDMMNFRQRVVMLVFVGMLGLLLLPMGAVERGIPSNALAASHNDRSDVRPMSGWVASRFDPGFHELTPLPPPLQTRSGKKSLKPTHRQTMTFQEAVALGQLPGIAFAIGDAPVRAVAAGIVHFVGESKRSNRYEGGSYVRIVHDFYDGLRKKSYPREPLYRYQAYRSTYYHLESVHVSHWQAVKRGAVIGYAKRAGAAGEPVVKLVLEERGNLVNPDAYGLHHDQLTYRTVHNSMEITLEEMNRRLDMQSELVETLSTYYLQRKEDDVFRKIHMVTNTEKFKQFPVEWSTLDRFRYLSHQYAIHPEHFPQLSTERFTELQERFYSHQPIVLSLPF